MIYYDRLKQHMETMIGKYKETHFSIDSIGRMSKTFAWSCENRNFRKGDIRTDIKNPAKIVYWNKQWMTYNFTFIKKVKYVALKYASNLFGVSTKYLRQKTRKAKYNRYTI